MKRIQHLILLLAALASSNIVTASAGETLPGAAAQPSSHFYTGKPYDEDLGGYVFNYRNYNPQVNRWTTSDVSGFPDGPNNHMYANGQVTYAFDPNGLDTQAISMDATTHKWEGAFIWSFEHGKESKGTKINEQPGYSGWTGVGLEMEISGVKIGIGVLAEAKIINNSNMETEMRGSEQWKRWSVDMEVQLWKKVMFLGQLHTEKIISDSIKTKGDWYE